VTLGPDCARPGVMAGPLTERSGHDVAAADYRAAPAM
jgi:hypothetical protein